MSTNKLLEAYTEFQAIVQLLHCPIIIESFKKITIKTHEGIDVELLNELNTKCEIFEAYCYPFNEGIQETIDDIELGSSNVKGIEYISIILEKDFFVKDLGNLDYYFFDLKSIFTSFYDISRIGDGTKLNIGAFCITNKVSTETINFVPINHKVDINNLQKEIIDSNIADNIEYYLSHNKSCNHSFYFNPYAFFSKMNLNSNYQLESYIMVSFYKLIIECFADKREGNRYTIRGDKNISITISDEFETKNYTKLKDILVFLVSNQKYTEKYIIAKKVISLYLLDGETVSEFDNKLPNIEKTIKHYYTHYIEENIKDFFKTKDQLLKEAMNTSKVIYEQTDKINSSILASLLSLILLLVTTLYGSLNNLTFKYTFLIILVFVIFSFVYYLIQKNAAYTRYNFAKEHFLHFIGEITILQPEKVKEIEEIYIDKPLAELKKTFKHLFWALIAVNISIILWVVLFRLISVNFFEGLPSLIKHTRLIINHLV